MLRAIFARAVVCRLRMGGKEGFTGTNSPEKYTNSFYARYFETNTHVLHMNGMPEHSALARQLLLATRLLLEMSC